MLTSFKVLKYGYIGLMVVNVVLFALTLNLFVLALTLFAGLIQWRQAEIIQHQPLNTRLWPPQIQALFAMMMRIKHLALIIAMLWGLWVLLF
ncbi:hypothetical protein A2716_00630 [candidate division WWE3 bacterium RIFCSPHIGHO2_01_FULL_40_23]|uniref:Uncharacterized protein n=1 Tax=candidate division WWE3 bacterium RIFCSPLOWO2_01_FULL_41_18 TaxID=1802625 RepID=A0A1F4VEB1_UNCKA|nr:MAG: hypothetical protein A2716_00630 [candidate division WWE3 bacterium RIFCSPHIGHO2_01_FULL_40_23]OGC55499.1 MAG: hypothetical protein A3A78_00900 [candidate division WWE3 bacterium RIFCSPLOWO2_01_FULL_41_18]